MSNGDFLAATGVGAGAGAAFLAPKVGMVKAAFLATAVTFLATGFLATTATFLAATTFLATAFFGATGAFVGALAPFEKLFLKLSKSAGEKVAARATDFLEPALLRVPKALAEETRATRIRIAEHFILFGLFEREV
jgi:hypothetical protein